MKKIKVGIIIEVIWRDSHGITQIWTSEEELSERKKEDLLIKSIGYFLDEDKKFIRIHGGCYIGDKYKQQYSRILAIPKGCIKKIRKLK